MTPQAIAPGPAASAVSMCARHPNARSVGTCGRCGTFGCSDCLEMTASGWLCAACRERAVQDLPSLKGRANLAKMGLAATAAIDLLNSVVGFATSKEADSALSAVTGGLYTLVFITTVVLFCRWFHLMVRTALARGIELHTTPAAAVGSWFIPFVNLARPFTLTRTILGPAAGLVTPWQTFWIIGNMAANASVRVDAPFVDVASAALSALAAFFAIRVVNAAGDELNA